MSVYEMNGTVTFMFGGLRIDDNDPGEAIHEVEMMSIAELLDYADDVVEVHVEGQKVVQDAKFELGGEG